MGAAKARRKLTADEALLARNFRALWKRYQEQNLGPDGKPPRQQWLGKQFGWLSAQSMVYQHMSGRIPMNASHVLAYAKFFKVKAWEIDPRLREFEETMSDQKPASNDYDFVHSYRRRHVAGHGRQGVLDIDMDEVKQRLAFQRAWLMKRHLNIKTLEIGVVDGLSMLEKYEPGYTFLYDTSQRSILNRKVYALAGEAVPRLKRLIVHPKDMVEIASDNKSAGKDGLPEYPSEFLTADEVRNIIIGRTVWHCGDD